MKRKIFSILFALVLVLSLSLVTAVPVAAATLNVPAQYPTIQAAVNAANPAGGDTIIVAAGTYDEQVVITTSLTLQGAGDTTIIQPSGTSTLTSLYTLGTQTGAFWNGHKLASIIEVSGVGTAGVTIKDLKVDGTNINSAPSGATYIVGISYGETAGTIDDVTVVNMDTTSQNPRTYGMWLDAVATTVLVEVKNSAVTHYNKNGINARGAQLTVDIHDNSVTGPGYSPHVPNGILLINGATGTVSNNAIANHGYTGQWTACGIATWDVANAVIEKNTISAYSGSGIALSGPSMGTTGTTVRENTIVGAGGLAGVLLECPQTSNNTIAGNDIGGGTYGILLHGHDVPSYNPGEEAGTGNVIHSNNIHDNSNQGIWQSGHHYSDTSIHHNTVTNNSGNGIEIAGDNNSIHHNTVTISGGYGIDLTATSDSNTVHHNTLSGNTAGKIQNNGTNNKVFKN